MFLVDPDGPHFQVGIDRMKRLTPIFIVAVALLPKAPATPLPASSVARASRTCVRQPPPSAGHRHALHRMIFVHFIRDVFVCSLKKHSDIFQT
jgi:hypothetical protein